MKKIASFTVNHLDLLRGVYVSRIDEIGDEKITTFDIRVKRPNVEPVLNTAEIHAMEHLGATFLRNHPNYDNKTIYFGPMGCRTGFYLVLKGELLPNDIIELLKEMFHFMAEFRGEIPGASARDCGNYHDMNLPMAKYESEKYLNEVLNSIDESRMNYPQ